MFLGSTDHVIRSMNDFIRYRFHVRACRLETLKSEMGTYAVLEECPRRTKVFLAEYVFIRAKHLP
jgi:hypothetical protein